MTMSAIESIFGSYVYFKNKINDDFFIDRGRYGNLSEVETR